MANRGVAFPKLLQILPCFLRRLSSAPSPLTAVSPLTFEPKTDQHPTNTNPIIANATPTGTSHQIINLDDIKGLFSTVSTSKLFKSSVTLQMAAIEPMVDVGLWVMNSRLMETPVMKQLILGAIKHTFYDHFCAGKDLEEAGRTTTRLWEAGLRGMLDYGLEHATDNESCDHNLIEFIRTAESTKSLPPTSHGLLMIDGLCLRIKRVTEKVEIFMKQVSFVVVKITAICPPSLLRRVSDLLRWEFRDSAFHLPWKLNCLPIFSDSSPFYHTPKKPHPLTPEEEQDLQLSHERLFKICEKCRDANVPLLIDAEDTALQPAIDYLTYSSAMLYHKDDDPLLFGTIQAYLKDSKDRLVKLGIRDLILLNLRRVRIQWRRDR